jgi:hypothetical protein
VLEHRDELLGVGIALGAILGERPQHDHIERGRQPRVQLARRPGLGGDLLEGDGDGCLAFKGDGSGQQLVEDHPDRVEV